MYQANTLVETESSNQLQWQQQPISAFAVPQSSDSNPFASDPFEHPTSQLQVSSSNNVIYVTLVHPLSYFLTFLPQPTYYNNNTYYSK